MFKFTIFTLLAAALAIANPLPTPFEAYENHEELENRATIYTRPTEKAHHFVWIDPNPSRARITVYTQSKWTNTPSKATGFYWAVSASGNFDHGFKVDIPGSDKFSVSINTTGNPTSVSIVRETIADVGCSVLFGERRLPRHGYLRFLILRVRRLCVRLPRVDKPRLARA